MNDRGWIALSRDVFKDEAFEAEPFTKVQAWIWLLTEAEYEARTVPVKSGGHYSTVRLARGELCHSYSYMADAWGWSYKSVRTFVAYLKKTGKIGHASGTGRGTDRTIISITKFDSWQFGRNEAGTPSDDERASLGQPLGNPRATKQTTLTTNTKDIGPGASRSGEPEGFSEWYETYPKKKKRDDAIKAFRQVVPSKVPLPELMELTAVFAKAWVARPAGDLQFCPYPASWLRSGEYRDKVEAPGAKNGGEFLIKPPEKSAAEFTEADWLKRLDMRKRGQGWATPYWGPEPGQPGCLVPSHLIVSSVNRQESRIVDADRIDRRGLN